MIGDLEHYRRCVDAEHGRADVALPTPFKEFGIELTDEMREHTTRVVAELRRLKCEIQELREKTKPQG